MDHLRHSGKAPEVQRAAFLDIIWRDPLVRTVLAGARDINLPDWWLVSGILYNSVWNDLTGKPSGHGVKDADLFYFEDADISYEAEDAVIRRGTDFFQGVSVPVEIRNQARVHLWYEEHFGVTCPKLADCSESIRRFASKTHAVGVKLLDNGDLLLEAPFGLDDIFSFRLTPNYAADNRATHHAKAERQMKLWPQLEVVPW
jgi:uncharacterized protein